MLVFEGDCKDKSKSFILEFEMIAPLGIPDLVGDKYELKDDGDYECVKNKRDVWSYNLLFLLEHPAHFRFSKVCLSGKVYSVSKGRQLNFMPTIHPDTHKYSSRHS